MAQPFEGLGSVYHYLPDRLKSHIVVDLNFHIFLGFYVAYMYIVAQMDNM